MNIPALCAVNQGDQYILSLFNWQFIGALSHQSGKFSEGQQVANFKSALRKITRAAGVRYQEVIWGLKLEYGRWNSRPHFHFVLTGFSQDHVTDASCRLLKSAWRQKGGGREADVQIFDRAKNGLSYIAKKPALEDGNEFRSTAKFGVNGENILFSENHAWAAKHSPFRAQGLL